MAHSGLKWPLLLFAGGLLAFWLHHKMENGAARIIIADQIHTLEEDMPTAQALAIDRHGKIISVGSEEDVLKLQGWFTKVEHLKGMTVLPGFIDPHMHTELAVTEPWIDIGPEDGACSTLDAAFKQLKERAEDFYHNNKLVTGWVLAKHLSPSIQSNEESQLKGDGITLALLESMTPYPLLIEEANGHFFYANKAAFELAFPDKTSCLWAAHSYSCLPDPTGGSYQRTPDGRLTGKIAESPAIALFQKALKKNIKVPGGYFATLNAIAGIFKRASMHGVTSVQDMGLGLSMGGLADTILADVGLSLSKAPVRFTGKVSVFANTSSLDSEKPFGSLMTIGKPFHNIHAINGVKMWSDGSNQAESGAQFEPYVGTNNTGKLNWDFATIKNVINTCNRKGWPLSIHANGNRAIDLALRAFEAAASETCSNGGCRKLRHRIEHSSLANDTQLDMMKHLGISPSFLIGHVYYYGKALRDILGDTRVQDLDRCASALSKGLRISMHSDYDVTDMDPLRMIETAVVRNMKYANGTLNPQERITRMQAVRAVTLDAAWQCHLDDIAGSIKVGKYADLAVLGSDPFVVKDTEIHSIEVKGTYLQGNRAYWKDTHVASEAAEAAKCVQQGTAALSELPKQDLISFASNLLKLPPRALAAAECMVRHADMSMTETGNQVAGNDLAITV